MVGRAYQNHAKINKGGATMAKEYIYENVLSVNREVQHIRQAYSYKPRIAAEKYIGPSNRNGYTIFECLECHETQSTAKRFREQGRANKDMAEKRYRAWLKIHGAHCSSC